MNYNDIQHLSNDEQNEWRALWIIANNLTNDLLWYVHLNSIIVSTRPEIEFFVKRLILLKDKAHDIRNKKMIDELREANKLYEFKITCMQQVGIEYV